MQVISYHEGIFKHNSTAVYGYVTVNIIFRHYLESHRTLSVTSHIQILYVMHKLKPINLSIGYPCHHGWLEG